MLNLSIEYFKFEKATIWNIGIDLNKKLNNICDLLPENEKFNPHNQ